MRGQRLMIFVCEQEPRLPILDDFRNAVHGGRDDRSLTRHRLEDDQRKAFAVRAQYEHVKRAHQTCDVGARRYRPEPSWHRGAAGAGRRCWRSWVA